MRRVNAPNNGVEIGRRRGQAALETGDACLAMRSAAIEGCVDRGRQCGQSTGCDDGSDVESVDGRPKREGEG